MAYLRRVVRCVATRVDFAAVKARLALSVDGLSEAVEREVGAIDEVERRRERERRASEQLRRAMGELVQRVTGEDDDQASH